MLIAASVAREMFRMSDSLPSWLIRHRPVA